MYHSMREILDYAMTHNTTFAEMMIREEMDLKGISRDEVRALMKQNLDVMIEALEKGLSGEGVKSVTGYTGKYAVKLQRYNEQYHALSGHDMVVALKGAISTNEVNAAMGIICATPTAGSSGTIPGILFKLENTRFNRSADD